MTYRFLSVAEKELEDAIVFYESASPGLGLAFLEEIEKTIARILKHPNAWANVSESHRRCRTRKFPYGLIYAIEGDEIIISAVMHLPKASGFLER